MIEEIKKDEVPESGYPTDSICPFLGIFAARHNITGQPMLTASACIGKACKPCWSEELQDCRLKLLDKLIEKKEG